VKILPLFFFSFFFFNFFFKKKEEKKYGWCPCTVETLIRKSSCEYYRGFKRLWCSWKCNDDFDFWDGLKGSNFAFMTRLL